MNCRSLLKAIVGGAALVVGINSSVALADELRWNFSFQLSSGDVGNGSFVSDSTPVGGPYLITSIVGGTLDGSPIALLPPGAPPDDKFNDNLLFPTQPFFDGSGLGFTHGGVQWALWSAGGNVVDSWCNNSVTGGNYNCAFPGPPEDPHGAVIGFTLTPAVPEPGTMGLMLAGLVAAGLRTRCRHGATIANRIM